MYYCEEQKIAPTTIKNFLPSRNPRWKVSSKEIHPVTLYLRKNDVSKFQKKILLVLIRTTWTFKHTDSGAFERYIFLLCIRDIHNQIHNAQKKIRFSFLFNFKYARALKLLLLFSFNSKTRYCACFRFGRTLKAREERRSAVLRYDRLSNAVNAFTNGFDISTLPFRRRAPRTKRRNRKETMESITCLLALLFQRDRKLQFASAKPPRAISSFSEEKRDTVTNTLVKEEHIEPLL